MTVQAFTAEIPDTGVFAARCVLDGREWTGMGVSREDAQADMIGTLERSGYLVAIH